MSRTRIPEDWDGELWREPDAFTEDWAVWYGPAGEEGDVATEVEYEGGWYRVSEYQDVTGSITPDDPDEPILVTTRRFDEDDILAALDELGEDDPESSLDWLRLVAGYGVSYMAYWGGDEDWTDALPAEA